MTRADTKKRKSAASAATTPPQHTVPAVLPAAEEGQGQGDTPIASPKEQALEKQAQALQRQIDAAEQRSARLARHLEETQLQLHAVRAELEALKETYHSVGPGTVALANRIAVLSRRAPWLVSPLASIVRALS